MGIAVAAVYLPLFVLASVVAFLLGRIPLRYSRESKVPLVRKAIAYVVGAITTVAVTMFTAWWYSTHATNEWAPLIGSLALSLVGPIGVGLLLMTIWSSGGPRRSSALGFITVGALHSIVALPPVGILTLAYYDDLVHRPSFDRLCESAHPTVVERVEPAKSVALIYETPEVFSERGIPRLGAILQKGALDYVEVQRHQWDGTDKYYQLTREPADGTKALGSLYEKPVTAISAEYVVVRILLTLGTNYPKWMAGSRIEVKRSSDKKVIAHFYQYWAYERPWQCPASMEDSSTQFVIEALNLTVPKQ